MKRVDFVKPELHLLVCFNSRTADHSMSSCGPDVNLDDYLELKKEFRMKYGTDVKLTKTSCLGICPQEGFMVMVYPEKEYYQVTSFDEVREFVSERFK